MNIDDRVTLYQEYRLIEKSESEINAAWKGAHLLLFFLAFVFGSFCTFCFHVLMYLFDEKCILYPKLLSLKDLRRSGPSGVILDYIAKKHIENLPVDFVTTQWMDQSTCYLPRYVPLLSSICGLVWTTMFLMCSSGSRSLTGLQRPWRILPPVFLFSAGMGSLCVYVSLVTQNGLNQLCTKLGEFTGTNTCTYAINVATLAYERRIRGVYQATQLTIFSAWLHTLCWVGAALLALARVILVVDFRLVRVRADLVGNLDKILERQEKHIRTDEFWNKMDKGLGTDEDDGTVQYMSMKVNFGSKMSIIPAEQRKMILKSKEERRYRIIGHMLRQVLDKTSTSDPKTPETKSSVSLLDDDSSARFLIKRTIGERSLGPSKSTLDLSGEPLITPEEAELHAKNFREKMRLANQQLFQIISHEHLPSYKSILNLTPEMNKIVQAVKKRQSMTAETGIQTTKQKKDERKQIVKQTTPKHSIMSMETLTADGEGDQMRENIALEYDKPSTSLKLTADEDKVRLRVLFDSGQKDEDIAGSSEDKAELKKNEPKPRKDSHIQSFFFTLGSFLGKRIVKSSKADVSSQTPQPEASTSTDSDKQPIIDKETQTRKKEKQD